MIFKKLLITIFLANTFLAEASKQWTIEQANRWYARQPFLMGCNFIPSTAINQIEMWQETTWDPKTIDKELKWASEIGFNTIRVYLNNLVFESEGNKFLDRIDSFLSIATKYRIKTMFVFWDDCHWAEPSLGKQPDPVKGVHNSGWKQSPGYYILKAHAEGYLDPAIIKEYEKYIKTVLKRFKKDGRVLAWDLYNEVGQGQNKDNGVKLLRLTWDWAWAIRPAQPLTSCIFGSESNIAKKINTNNSDVYSYHFYAPDTKAMEFVQRARKESKGRPVFCTEYMARPQKNTFEECLPVFKKEHIANWCWGLVEGKTGTIWPWSSRTLVAGAISPIPTVNPDSVPDEPELWFHDILRRDGTPYILSEINFLKNFNKNYE